MTSTLWDGLTPSVVRHDASTVEIAEPLPATFRPTWRDVLHRTADLLEEFGWDRNESVAYDGEGHVVGYCVGRAYLQAKDDLGVARLEREGWDELRSMLGLEVPVSSWNLYASCNEVIARLRATADASTGANDGRASELSEASPKPYFVAGDERNAATNEPSDSGSGKPSVVKPSASTEVPDGA